jgi:hypothetical protein
MQVKWQIDRTYPYLWYYHDIQEGRTSTDRVFLDCGEMGVETVGEQQMMCIIGFWNNYKGNYLTKLGTGLVIEKLPYDLYRRIGYFEHLPTLDGGGYDHLYGSEKIIKMC